MIHIGCVVNIARWVNSIRLGLHGTQRVLMSASEIMERNLSIGDRMREDRPKQTKISRTPSRLRI